MSNKSHSFETFSSSINIEANSDVLPEAFKESQLVVALNLVKMFINGSVTSSNEDKKEFKTYEFGHGDKETIKYILYTVQTYPDIKDLVLLKLLDSYKEAGSSAIATTRAAELLFVIDPSFEGVIANEKNYTNISSSLMIIASEILKLKDMSNEKRLTLFNNIWKLFNKNKKLNTPNSNIYMFDIIKTLCLTNSGLFENNQTETKNNETTDRTNGDSRATEILKYFTNLEDQAFRFQDLDSINPAILTEFSEPIAKKLSLKTISREILISEEYQRITYLFESFPKNDIDIVRKITSHSLSLLEETISFLTVNDQGQETHFGYLHTLTKLIEKYWESLQFIEGDQDSVNIKDMATAEIITLIINYRELFSQKFDNKVSLEIYDRITKVLNEILEKTSDKTIDEAIKAKDRRNESIIKPDVALDRLLDTNPKYLEKRKEEGESPRWYLLVKENIKPELVGKIFLNLYGEINKANLILFFNNVCTNREYNKALRIASALKTFVREDESATEENAEIYELITEIFVEVSINLAEKFLTNLKDEMTGAIENSDWNLIQDLVFKLTTKFRNIEMIRGLKHTNIDKHFLEIAKLVLNLNGGSVNRVKRSVSLELKSLLKKLPIEELKGFLLEENTQNAKKLGTIQIIIIEKENPVKLIELSKSGLIHKEFLNKLLLELATRITTGDIIRNIDEIEKLIISFTEYLQILVSTKARADGTSTKKTIDAIKENGKLNDIYQKSLKNKSHGTRQLFG